MKIDALGLSIPFSLTFHGSHVDRNILAILLYCFLPYLFFHFIRFSSIHNDVAFTSAC